MDPVYTEQCVVKVNDARLCVGGTGANLCMTLVSDLCLCVCVYRVSQAAWKKSLGLRSVKGEGWWWAMMLDTTVTGFLSLPSSLSPSFPPFLSQVYPPLPPFSSPFLPTAISDPFLFSSPLLSFLSLSFCSPSPQVCSALSHNISQQEFQSLFLHRVYIHAIHCKTLASSVVLDSIFTHAV